MIDNLVSVIMSAYNSESTIEKSILSIIKQDYKKLEFLIVDDCSTDNTYNICKKYSKLNKSIKLFRNKSNIGLTKSLNLLIDQAKGEYIARQDADDVSLSNRISHQVEFIKKYNLDACSTRAYIMENNSIIHSKSYYLPKHMVIKFKNPFVHGTLLIKTEILKKLGKYDENFYYSQDFKLMKDLIKENYRIRIIKDPLYCLNNKENISTNNKLEQKYYANCVIKNKIPKHFLK